MATCKDCLYFPMCKNIAIGNMTITSDACECFSDKSRFVELPCKIGDTVYSVETTFNVPIEGKIYEICFRSGILCFKVARKGYFSLELSEDYIGKTIFLTREEAEAALAERRDVEP